MMYHVTAEGQKVSIAGMTDSHLVNTIAYFGRKLADLTKQSDEMIHARSQRAAALYGATTWDPDEYVQEMKDYYRTAGPYCVEAALRGLNIQPILAKIMGRDCQDPEAPTIENVPKPLAGLMADLWPEEFDLALPQPNDED